MSVLTKCKLWKNVLSHKKNMLKLDTYFSYFVKTSSTWCDIAPKSSTKNPITFLPEVTRTMECNHRTIAEMNC